MTTPDEQFNALYQFAQTLPDVFGLFLSGSRGKGFHSAHSDYDVWLITSDNVSPTDILAAFPFATDKLDLLVMPLSAFRSYAAYGSATDWQRYSFAHVRVLLDKAGDLQTIVNEKGQIPVHFQQPLIHGALDAYLNSIYRSAKCFRNRNLFGARLEACESIGHFLSVIFAREGRHRPYYGYLEQELSLYPLISFPLESKVVLTYLNLIAATGDLPTQQALLRTVDSVCRAEGYEDVFASWGQNYHWMATYKLTAL